RIGVGFGGPLDAEQGTITKSHQVQGWDGFPLQEWCQQQLGLPTLLGNDCDVATLAEASLGAGKEFRAVFYVTVGTGVGGGYVVDGKSPLQGRPAAAEIGHLRPGPLATSVNETVESQASGWGIVAATRRYFQQHGTDTNLDSVDAVERILETEADRADLLSRCGSQLDLLTARHVAEAARDGNPLAATILSGAIRVLGWGIAQMITLQAPEIVIVGGGVSLIGEEGFFKPLRECVAQYVFPPLRGTYQVVPAALGELAVVQGAIIRASQ
ncbi:MAG TPA: ROK family protein, partial [Planctomycetaceae bacterium]|nr:ROK family protein [Planctomycetaceae bacterium]